MSASAEAAAHRRVEAGRKRVEREERRAAGLPDRRTVDTVVSAALAQVLREGNAAARIQARGSARGIVVDGEAVLRAAIKGLTSRGVTKEAASRPSPSACSVGNREGGSGVLLTIRYED